MPGLGELRRVSAPRLIRAGWRKTIAVSALSLLYGNLMGWCVLILRASRSFWDLFMSVSLLKRGLIRLLRPISVLCF